MRQPLESPQDQRSARNLLAWADRIMEGGYGDPGSDGYENAVDSWRHSYKSFRARLPNMEKL